MICDSNIYRKHHYAEALTSVYMVSAKNPPPTSYLISYPFPALPPIPPHIGLQLNKFNLRWELSGLLESLHLLDLASIQFYLGIRFSVLSWHQIFSIVSHLSHQIVQHVVFPSASLTIHNHAAWKPLVQNIKHN